MSIITIILILCISFIAGIEGILDEFQFHQPLIACTLIGLVSGYFEEGLLLGGTLQLIALGWANIGASVAPDVTLASIISSILMVLGLQSNIDSQQIIAIAILISIPLSLIGLFLTKIYRTQAIQIVRHMDSEALKGNISKMEMWHILGVCMQGIRVVIPTFAMMLIPADWILNVFNGIPASVLEGLVIGVGMVPAVGFAIVINVLSSKETWPFFAFGFVLAAVSELTSIGIAIVGFAMMCIYMSIVKTETYASENNKIKIPLEL